MNPVIGAALWMGGALLSFALMAIAGRELSAELVDDQFLGTVTGIMVSTSVVKVPCMDFRLLE